jgi:hypothetical protein
VRLLALLRFLLIWWGLDGLLSPYAEAEYVAGEMAYLITPFEFRSQSVLLLHSASCGLVAVLNIPRLSTQFMWFDNSCSFI